MLFVTADFFYLLFLQYLWLVKKTVRMCIFCKKLPAMCNGDDLYAAIAASGRRLIKQGQFGEGSAVGRVERYPPMELNPYCPME